MIQKAKNGEKLPVYGDGRNIRDWIHVQDHCEAIDTVLHKGRDGEVYNIGGQDERRNIEIVDTIIDKIGIKIKTAQTSIEPVTFSFFFLLIFKVKTPPIT